MLQKCDRDDERMAAALLAAPARFRAALKMARAGAQDLDALKDVRAAANLLAAGSARVWRFLAE